MGVMPCKKTNFITDGLPHKFIEGFFDMFSVIRTFGLIPMISIIIRTVAHLIKLRLACQYATAVKIKLALGEE